MTTKFLTLAVVALVAAALASTASAGPAEGAGVPAEEAYVPFATDFPKPESKTAPAGGVLRAMRADAALAPSAPAATETRDLRAAGLGAGAAFATVLLLGLGAFALRARLSPAHA